MKYSIFFVSFFFLPICLLYSQIDKLQIDYKKEKVILFGENHDVLENYEIKDMVIKKVLSEYNGNINILLEYPKSIEYFICKNDSSGLKNYFNNIYNEKSEPSNYFKLKYQFIVDIKNLIRNDKLKIVCVDRENHLRALAYTCSIILNNYKENEFIYYYKTFLDSLLNKNILKQNDYTDFEDKFRVVLNNHIMKFNEIISDTTDFYFLKEILVNPLQIYDFDTRERILYNNFNKEEYRESFCIGFLGSAHINKYYYKKNKIFGINNSLAVLLSKNKNSFFKNKIKTILIANYKYDNKPNTKLLGFNNEEFQLLIELCKNKNSILINPKDYKMKFAAKAYDFILFIDNATRIK